MENKRVLVVCGSGYVGRELVDQLTNHGYTVMSLSRGGQYLPNATVIKGNALDIGLMEKLLGDFDIVVYLAAVILRPNYVYGLDCDNDFARLAKIIHRLRICPVLAGGRTKFFPVHKSDLARIVVEEILYSLESFVGSTVDVSGENCIYINDIVNYYRQIIPKRFLRVHVPFTLLKIMKPLIPLDVDWFNISSIRIQDRCFLGKSDIYKDLSMIIAQQAS